MVSISSGTALLACLLVRVLSSISDGYKLQDDGSFTLELIHRDSPHSPLYNPLENKSRTAFHRSMSRAPHFHHSSSEPTTTVFPYIEAGYLTKFSIGTPPVENLVFVDTGSPVTWIQCKPCVKCYKQTPPVFDPKHSPSNKKIPCKSSSCIKESISGFFVGCLNTTSICQYQLSYADGSIGQGDLSTDTFTFPSNGPHPVVVPKLVYGCGHINGGAGHQGNVTGLIGLSDSPFSLVSQMGFSKFSYCLPPVSGPATGKLKVGSHAEISGKGKITLPFKIETTFYIPTLKGLSVGKYSTGRAINIGIIFDSGSTLTSLPPKIYAGLDSAVRSSIKFKPTEDPGEQFNLCYSKKLNVEVPVITFHFAGGDVKLSKANTFVDNGDTGVECLAMEPTDDEPIFGCLSQQNHQVEYDLKMKTISLVPAECTTF